MSKMTPNFEKIESLMGDFFEGKIDARYVIQNWPNSEKSMSAEEALLIHELHHFYADEDIRAKDEKYALMQSEGLKKRYAALK